jgi:hypothetical protein
MLWLHGERVQAAFVRREENAYLTAKRLEHERLPGS